MTKSRHTTRTLAVALVVVVLLSGCVSLQGGPSEANVALRDAARDKVMAEARSWEFPPEYVVIDEIDRPPTAPSGANQQNGYPGTFAIVLERPEGVSVNKIVTDLDQALQNQGLLPGGKESRGRCEADGGSILLYTPEGLYVVVRDLRLPEINRLEVAISYDYIGVGKIGDIADKDTINRCEE